jgi:Family of unknown function (DUF6345)/Bacterial Ig domain
VAPVESALGAHFFFRDSIRKSESGHGVRIKNQQKRKDTVMKKELMTRGILGGILSLGLLTQTTFGQTNLLFTGINATDEGAIQFHWVSQSNHVYEIDEADALIDTNTGSITWNKLYDDYPSQGTNTFIGDFGNYDLVPAIVHPKNSPMRFYRVVDEGLDDLTNDEPRISLVSPTNGTVVSGGLTITVSANTDQRLSYTTLYVDGEEMDDADSVSNYFENSTNYEVDTYSINTCEWGNGLHTLFATARSASEPEGAHDVPIALIGHAVSTFVPVTFSNLVTRISFSQPFFDPNVGQTQQVSAVFAANSDWTLNIIDIHSNIVKTATGSGTSMLYNWDGTGNGGTNLPAGVYYYYISAETNGESDEIGGGGSGGSSGSGPPSPDFASPSSVGLDSSELWAMPIHSSGAAVPFVIYPPGFDTNDLIIFPASLSEMRAQSDFVSGVEFSPKGSGFFPDDDASPSAQTTPNAPKRPPTAPVRGVSGTFGVAYQTYTANGSSGYTPARPDNGLHIGINIQMEGYTTNIPFHSIPEFKSEANNFIKAMKKGGWSSSFVKANDQLNISDLRGGGTPFNQVNLGVLMTHGTFGTTIDYSANGCKQMYFPIASSSSSQYLRMSEMNFGGSGTNGLEWMALMACFSLYHTDWQNMQSLGVKPYNSNLHLLLGCDTIIYTESTLLKRWAKDMIFGTSGTPMTIQAAWYQAGTDAYHGEGYSIPITFAVAGDDACQNDTLQTSSTPTGTPYYNRLQIYTP